MLEIMAGKSEDHSKMLSNRLGQAIVNGELEHVRMYIEQGADINRQCYSGKHRKIYPLPLSCLHGHEEVMEVLLKAGADPNHVSGWWSRPAMFLAAKQRVLTLSMMRCLISHGANVNIRGYRRKTILNYLTLGQFNDTHDNILSAAKLVLENGASFNARDRFGYTLLYEACKSGNIDLVKLCIARGAKVNSDIGDKTMLRVAADVRNIEMFSALLNAGAERQLTPAALYEPCEQNDHAMIKKILDACDVDINMPLGLNQSVGMTILHYACIFPKITGETVRLLLDRGADVRAVTDTGHTALHYAAGTSGCDKIRQLLTYNPPLNIKNNMNWTPLAELSHYFFFLYFFRSCQHARAHVRSLDNTLSQAGVLPLKMLVTAGAKITTFIEHVLNDLRHKHPDAQLPDYEISSTRSLKEMCRFVIRETLPVAVDANLRNLPIPKLLQNFLNFPEFDQLVEDYLNIIATTQGFVPMGQGPLS